MEDHAHQGTMPREGSEGQRIAYTGLPADGTIAAEVAFMFNEWYRPDCCLEFPRGGSQAIVQALVRCSARSHRACRIAACCSTQSMRCAALCWRLEGLSLHLKPGHHRASAAEGFCLHRLKLMCMVHQEAGRARDDACTCKGRAHKGQQGAGAWLRGCSTAIKA